MSNRHSLYEDGESILEIYDFKNKGHAESMILSKSKVHFLFCLKEAVNFQFSPHYGRTLGPNRIFIIHNPEQDLNPATSSPVNGILFHLAIKLQKLHQLFSPESQSAPIFQPEHTQVKSYEEMEMISDLIVVLNGLLQKRNHNRLYYQAKVLEIISLLFAGKSEQANHCPFLKNEATVRKIKQAKEILIEHFKKPPTIPELARSVQLNELQLKVGFKEIYGNSPYNFLLTHKLEIAKQLLLTGDYQVQEAAYQIGYTNISHFIAAFKKQFGVTPKKLLMR